MTLKWDELPKPWTKEQCRRRYVECEDDIGIRGLSKVSGQGKGSIERWVKAELWLAQRYEYREVLRTTIQEKTIEKTSDKISDELSEIVTEGYTVHKLARDYAAKIIEAKARQLVEDLRLTGDDKKKALSNHNAAEMNQWSQMLRRSTDAINDMRGIKYFADINAAADKLQREGYEILDPS
jgi:predicted house-cleaning noncanonical NTP pyrophosphatase (MazG superfamily)